MANVQAALEALQARKDQTAADLAKSEQTLYDLETHYLGAEYCKYGTVFKGFEGFLSSKDAARKRLQGFKAEDRLFSLSSHSSQARRDLELGQSDLMDAGHVSHRLGTFSSKGIAQKGRRSL